ncbi:MAG: DRTGG domain-containing protein [Acutalibacteraceae bacterium]|nr:DRTGG domain-containing protein [Acutalibacteraceae bacterium]
MTVKQLCENCGFTPICLPEPDRTVSGAYMGDLLSWVMGRAQENNAWITIMSNINVAAVASLSDVACVILTEDVTLEDDVLAVCNQKGVNVLCSSLPSFETAIKLYGMV